MSFDLSQSQPRGRILSRGESTDDGLDVDPSIDQIMATETDDALGLSSAKRGHAKLSSQLETNEDEYKPILSGTYLHHHSNAPQTVQLTSLCFTRQLRCASRELGPTKRLPPRLRCS